MPEKHVIICLDNPSSYPGECAKTIQTKWINKRGRHHSHCKIIYLNEEKPTELADSDLGSIGPNTKISIISHGNPDHNASLPIGKKSTIPLDQLASVINKLTATKWVTTVESPLRISLLCCYGSYKRSPDIPSIAENLHREIHKQGLETEVTARETPVVIGSDGRKFTYTAASSANLLKLRKQLAELPADDELTKADLKKEMMAILNHHAYEHNRSHKILHRRLPTTSGVAMGGAGGDHTARRTQYAVERVSLTHKPRSPEHVHRTQLACQILNGLKRACETESGIPLTEAEQAIFNTIKHNIATRGHDDYLEISIMVERMFLTYCTRNAEDYPDDAKTPSTFKLIFTNFPFIMLSIQRKAYASRSKTRMSAIGNSHTRNVNTQAVLNDCRQYCEQKTERPLSRKEKQVLDQIIHNVYDSSHDDWHDVISIILSTPIPESILPRPGLFHASTDASTLILIINRAVKHLSRMTRAEKKATLPGEQKAYAA